MSDELVEALAKKLYEAGESSPFGHGNRWRDAGMGARSQFDRVANECLRQMEYARRCVGISGPTTIETTELRFGEIVPVTKIIAPAELHFSDLALAPEDWKP